MKRAVCNLLLLLIALVSCTESKRDTRPTVLYENGKAFGISFDRALIKSSEDSVRTYTKLFLHTAEYPVVTAISVTNNRIVLTTETALLQGMSYDVVYPDYDHNVFSFIIPVK